MKSFIFLLSTILPFLPSVSAADPLSYRIREPAYILPKPDSVTTLLDFISSRSNLTQLRDDLNQSAGFNEAFNTNPTWNFTLLCSQQRGLSAFNETYQRIQTGTYLFIGAELQNDELLLNKVARVVEGDIPVTRGVVHIIDRILEPAAQIHEEDLPWLKQAFIAWSCSNPLLPYC
ncbi:hypothetical protein BJX70DRAFT_390422 [Aspergillus crustosus]